MIRMRQEDVCALPQPFPDSMSRQQGDIADCGTLRCSAAPSVCAETRSSGWRDLIIDCERTVTQISRPFKG